MTDDANETDIEPARCKSCNVPLIEHDGFTRTCAELLRIRAENADLIDQVKRQAAEIKKLKRKLS